MASVDLARLRQFTPLHGLSDENLERLAQRIRVEDVPRGTVLFRQGDTDNDAVYLLEGGLELRTHDSTLTRVLQAGAQEAFFPVAQVRPRPYTVTAVTDARVFRVDSARLDRALVLDEVTTTITRAHRSGARFAGDSAWLEEMMESPAFQRLSYEKLSQLMMRLEPVVVHAGEIVIRQSDRGECYYIVKDGRFAVSRKDAQGKVHVLSELRRGAVFGEEALIAGAPRNATVVALSDGVVMRLGIRDFDALLKQSLIAYVTPDEAKERVQRGAGLIDVREPAEYRTGAIKGSVNIALADLRRRLRELDPKREYVVCCRRGVQSEVAAFLLEQRGLRAYVLLGGIEGLGSAP
jgi:CRP-like cAMP-binding protein